MTGRGRTAARLLAWAAGAALVPLVLMAAFVDRLIFLPPPSSYGEDLDGLVLLPTATGDTVAAVLREVAGAGLAVVFTHGNAEDVGHLVDLVEGWSRLGVTALAVEYPGYGLSSGQPTEAGVYAAGDAALAHLATRGYPAERVILHGRSLGGAVAVDVAARHRVAGLVLESTFTSAFQVMLPFGGLPGDRFTSLAKLPRVQAPTLVIHGTQDEVVPFTHGERMFAALPEQLRRSWWVEGAGHNDLSWVAGARYWERLAGFLAWVEGGGPAPGGAS